VDREKSKRRALYAVTVLGWVIAAALAVMDMESDADVWRVGLIMCVATSATLSNVTLFAIFVAPLETVYKHGYEAGMHSTETFRARSRPKLIIGERLTGPRRMRDLDTQR
jgi:hypothetical protein